MRRRFCLPVSTLLCLAVPAVGTAQQVGIILGANVSTVSETFQAIKAITGAAVKTERRVGFNGGIFVNKSLVGPFSLQPEAHYSQTGVTYSVSNSSATVSAALKVDYVEIPVLLRMDFGKGSPLHPFVYGGAGGAFRITCDISTTAAATTVTKACSENTTSTSKDPIEKYDVSAIGGAGLALSGLGRSFALSARYSHGLSKVTTETTGAAPKNSVFSVQMAIGF